MFGFKNFSGFAFITKVGNFTIEFAVGVVEEVTINITDLTTSTIATTNSSSIPQTSNLNFLSKDRIITTTALIVSSKVVRKNAFSLIAGATSNLFI